MGRCRPPKTERDIQIVAICSQRRGRYARWPVEYVCALFGISEEAIRTVCYRAELKRPRGAPAPVAWMREEHAVL